jgi:tRNA pseudouridine55 synthase
MSEFRGGGGASLKAEFDNKLFVIDKCKGPTSFDVVMSFRKATRLRKVGHTGTLDPLAEGVLLICTGMATRAVEHFMNLEKEYRFEIHLGIETTTLDAEGDVVREEPCPELSEPQIADVAASFVGPYELTPPVFSAIKQGGKRMYEMARSGEAPQPEKRRVEIYHFDILAVSLPIVECRVVCSRGTYVRSLARDLGDKLGVPAHIRRLERTRIGPFDRASAFPSQKLTRAEIGAIEGRALGDALEFLPGAILAEKARKALRYGILPETRDVVSTLGTVEEGPVRLLDDTGGLVAIGNRAGGRRRNPLLLVDSYRLFVDTSQSGHP